MKWDSIGLEITGGQVKACRKNTFESHSLGQYSAIEPRGLHECWVS